MRLQNKHQKASQQIKEPAADLTFIDHVHELKSRLFYVALSFVIATGVAYPFTQKIIDILMLPLGDEKLYYLSPAGGLSFTLKICMYVGVVGVLPVLIYHLYKFVSPVIPVRRPSMIFGYAFMSLLLACAGVIFAYFISLPAALHFLTQIDLHNITAMLTIDAYMSFIMAYLIAGALLFQLPLVMLIINSVSPLSPGKLLGYQRHIIVGSFVIAAIISPTPDVVNQTILAAPMVIMYQIGIVIVWIKQRSRRSDNQRAQKKQLDMLQTSTPKRVQSTPLPTAIASIPAPQATGLSQPSRRTTSVHGRVISDFKPQPKHSASGNIYTPHTHTTLQHPSTPEAHLNSLRLKPSRTIDSVVRTRTAHGLDIQRRPTASQSTSVAAIRQSTRVPLRASFAD